MINKIVLRYFILMSLFVVSLTSGSSQNIDSEVTSYDMRTDLSPNRLTIAMWDFSWLYMHYKGGAFEDFDKVTDELLERGFNTVRIDAFPLIIGMLEHNGQKVTIPGNPLKNWGSSDKDRKHDVVAELLELMKITKNKGINVILSSWGQGANEFPNISDNYKEKERFWEAWDKVLSRLKENDLLGHVAYVDFDQEFPFFSPFKAEIERLGKEKPAGYLSDSQAMEAAGSGKNLSWNSSQMAFVKELMSTTLVHFQRKYPELKFTFSLTEYWKEVKAMALHSFDVLELHFWMTQSQRFMTRTGFSQLKKDRGEHDYSDYMDRINKTMQSVRPMLLKDMHNRMSWARDWSEEIAAPLVTTEAWGPWWHMDHKDLNWEWLYKWCEDVMEVSSEYKFWGVTPWNYSHPYWENWKNIDWYQKVNHRFLKSE